MTAIEKITAFLDEDAEKIADIIEKYPKQIPVNVVAELCGCNPDSLRCSIEQHNILGFSHRKPGKLNHGFVIPTAHFVYWYFNKNKI